MRYLLWFAGGYNLLVGLNMVVFPDRNFETFDLPKPELMFFVHFVGLMVALFGAGYCLVAYRPLDNRSLLLFGFCGKVLAASLGIAYVISGKLPPTFLAVTFFSDIIYLPPFAIILRHLKRAAARERELAARSD